MIPLAGGLGGWYRQPRLTAPKPQPPTVLLSTSALWNCGDDWIREGLLAALRLKPGVRVLWWNRGWGVRDRYQNALAVNLPLADLVIMAGTPEWIDRNEKLYQHCLETDTPIALLGVGRTGGYIEVRHHDLLCRVARAGVVEVAIARDRIAADLLARYGIEAPVMCDPALFVEPVGTGGELAIVGWRGLAPVDEEEPYKLRAGGTSAKLDRALLHAFWALPHPKLVVVHDNREVAAAQRLFGAEAVFFSSNPADLLKVYGRARYYVGCRIHGFVPSLVHGAAAHLVYQSDKAKAADTIIERLGLERSAKVTRMDMGETLEPDLGLQWPGRVAMDQSIEREKAEFVLRCRSAEKLATMMEA